MLCSLPKVAQPAEEPSLWLIGPGSRVQVLLRLFAAWSAPAPGTQILFPSFSYHFTLFAFVVIFWGFPGGSDGKVSAHNAGDPGSIPGSGRSPGEGNGNPLQYSGLENSMDGGAWWATVHGVTKSQTRLSDFTFTLKFTECTWCLLLLLLLSLESKHVLRVLCQPLHKAK